MPLYLLGRTVTNLGTKCRSWKIWRHFWSSKCGFRVRVITRYYCLMENPKNVSSCAEPTGVQTNAKRAKSCLFSSLEFFNYEILSNAFATFGWTQHVSMFPYTSTFVLWLSSAVQSPKSASMLAVPLAARHSQALSLLHLKNCSFFFNHTFFFLSSVTVFTFCLPASFCFFTQQYSFSMV